MDVIRPNSKRKKIRPALVFFCTTWFFTSCASEVFIDELQIRYEEGAAYGVQFVSNGSNEYFQVFLQGEKETAVLGEFTTVEDEHWFSPAVAFTRGNTYEIYYNETFVEAFTIPLANKQDAPEIVNIYPSTDTVPENLLKVYLQFSQPMQEVGNALDFIKVLDETENKEVMVFLELESELWNASHDRLTLWLDPGRIKTDLIPNREQGLPLRQGHTYQLAISKSWKDAKGVNLKQEYQKEFYVTKRDQETPKPALWKIQTPKSETKDTLKLGFKEPLDAILVKETIFLSRDSGEEVVGNTLLNEDGTFFNFIPINNWKKGNYIFIIKPILEDLAGNNLLHLFDTDNTRPVETSSANSNHEIRFIIQ